MDKLLRFLNTADVNLLATIPGITPKLAEDLVGARPFDSTDECLKVKGMNKKLLTSIETALEANEFEEQPYALVPAEEEGNYLEKINQPAKERVSDDKPSFGTRLGNALRSFFLALFRLILLLLVIGGIGAAIYFGLPVLRERYIVPVEQNSARVSQLENEVAILKTQLSEMNNRLDVVNVSLDEMNTSIDAHTASLEKLEDMQSTIETQLEENNNQTLTKLKQEVMMTRALDTLARARLYLAQSNFGLAKEDVQSARDVLAELEIESSDELLIQAIARLDLALGNLPSFPVVASGDLEIAWQILMTGEVTATVTVEPTSASTSTPEPTLEVTATATP